MFDFMSYICIYYSHVIQTACAMIGPYRDNKSNP